MEITARPTHRSIPVIEASQPSAARRAARDLADRASFTETDSYRTGLVATELATNLVKHARRGEMLIRPVVAGNNVSAIELLAIDRGPGIENVAASLADGRSTAGSAGNGLGAIRRLADEFDIYSTVPRGTVILARIRGNASAARPSPIIVAGVSVARAGEIECGDAWAVVERPDSILAVLADGLGHGHFAAAAAAAALDAFHKRPYPDCAAALAGIHDGLRHTRGAAGAAVEVSASKRIVKFAGVGNISAALWRNGAVRQTVSHNGTLGHQASHFREYTYPWDSQSLLVMHSDGLTSHWSLDTYPGLVARHPAIVAGVLYRDFNRGRDDVTIVAAREAA